MSLSSAKRYVRMTHQGRSLVPKKVPESLPEDCEDAQRLLEEDMKERPAATIADRQRFLEHIVGTRLSGSTVRRFLKRLGFSRKLPPYSPGINLLRKPPRRSRASWEKPKPELALLEMLGTAISSDTA